MYEKEGMNNPPVVVQATIPQGTASNPVPIYGRPASATSNPIYATAPGSANPVYAQPTYPNADSNTNRLGPPTGAWRDGICDCCTNLWPSCGCLLFCHGAWILGQSKYIICCRAIFQRSSVLLLKMKATELQFADGSFLSVSQKVGYIPFRNIMLPMLIIEIICFFCALFLGGWVRYQ
jgi:hypothetical protein